MTKKELMMLANNLKLSLGIVDQIKDDDQRFVGRGAILRVTEEVWFSTICFDEKHRKFFDDHQDWRIACGFNTFGKPKKIDI